ncbi:alpha/beta hydrolase [Gordonia desulfuricans]|nr:alpha/beta hydrolase family protein [Gordonia desulfuricans]
MTVVATVLIPLANVIGAGSAVGEPTTTATLVERVTLTPQQETLVVHSPAMGKSVPLTVLRPTGSAPAPTLYLLNGAGGGEDSASWGSRTDYTEFFADKHVNVITPLLGAFSYYTDWQRDDPTIGRHKWETFLTRELPPLLDRELHTTGANAVAGISMAGTSVLNLATHAPGLYRAVASYSGCARTSDPLGQAYIRAVVQERGGADLTNMWGPLNGPGWRDHDPYLNAATLRGLSIYLSSSSGLPGRDESLPADATADDTLHMADQVILGGGIEAAMNVCTRQMADRLHQLNIPATVHVNDTGTHSWGYWERELEASWPQLQAALTR